MIPAGFIQDLLSRIDIVELIGRHVQLKRSGANFSGLCPFHAEKSPSFTVSPSKQFFHCFGCGASGDAIRFLTEHSGLSFVEAVRELAGQIGMEVPEEQVSPQERERRERLRERRLGLTEALERAASFYRQQLRSSPRAIDYLKGRGLSGAVAARFGLGYAPAGWRSLAGVFPRYDDPMLEEAGLVRLRDGSAEDTSDAERSRYDWFRDRIMFPIRSVGGEVIGFGGRVLDDSKPKYMNSPETPLFSKGRELYGLFEARQTIRERGFALVVEGYMDVVALAQSGWGNAVATLGTACTPDHVQKLFRFTDAVVFAFDGDAAGRRAAARALEAALPQVNELRSVRFLFLPQEHDPDSYVRELGAQAFEQALAAAVPLSRQLVELAGEGCDLQTAEGRARLLAQARPLWSQLPDGPLKQQLLPEIARPAAMSTPELAQLWKLPIAGAPRERKAAAPFVRHGPPARHAPAAPTDLAVRLLMRHSQWWELLAADAQQLLSGLPGHHGEVVRWLERQLTEHGPMSWGALEEALRGHPAHPHVVTWVEGGLRETEPEFEELHQVLLRLRIADLQARAQALAAQGQTDGDALQALREIHARLRQLKEESARQASATDTAARPR